MLHKVCMYVCMCDVQITEEKPNANTITLCAIFLSFFIVFYFTYDGMKFSLVASQICILLQCNKVFWRCYRMRCGMARFFYILFHSLYSFIILSKIMESSINLKWNGNVPITWAEIFIASKSFRTYPNADDNDGEIHFNAHIHVPQLCVVLKCST